MGTFTLSKKNKAFINYFAMAKIESSKKVQQIATFVF